MDGIITKTYHGKRLVRYVDHTVNSIEFLQTLSRQQDLSRLAEPYKKIFEDDGFSTFEIGSYYQIHDALKSKLNGLEGKKILEIGAYCGEYINILSQFGASPVGVDSFHYEEILNEKSIIPLLKKINAPIHTQDISSYLKTNSERFDAIISNITLHNNFYEQQLKDLLCEFSERTNLQVHTMEKIEMHSFDTYLLENKKTTCIETVELMPKMTIIIEDDK